MIGSRIDPTFPPGYIPSTEWEVEYTDEFGEWWETLKEAEQIDVAAVVGLLEERGPMLPYPFSSGIAGSKHTHMRELRIQHAGDPYRVLYAFDDPRRVAILLIGGNKTGDNRGYDRFIPVADALYDRHLLEIASSPHGRKGGR